LPVELAERSIRLFAAEAMPHFAGRQRQPPPQSRAASR